MAASVTARPLGRTVVGIGTSTGGLSALTAFFERIPGYALLRSLTQQLAGQGKENVWKPAMVEIEEALVPAFIIEVHDDGRFTVFVPSVPTPLACALARSIFV